MGTVQRIMYKEEGFEICNHTLPTLPALTLKNNYLNGDGDSLLSFKCNAAYSSIEEDK